MHHAILHLLDQYGAGFVAVVIGLEAMGAPLPGESLLLAAAVYASTGHTSIHAVVWAAAVGAVLGDCAGWAIGRALGVRLLARYGARIGLTERRLQVVAHLFRTHGGKIVVGGRFVAFLRTVVALVAGAIRMPFAHFLVWDAVGGVLWTCLYGYGAYLLGAEAQKVGERLAIGLGVAAAVCAVPLVVWLRRAARRLEAEADGETASAPPG